MNVPVVVAWVGAGVLILGALALIVLGFIGWLASKLGIGVIG